MDLGTGCGILGILGALQDGKVTATDINPAAIECAKQNATHHKVADRMKFEVGDLFEPVKGEEFDLIVFNPPYLPRSGVLDGDPTGLSCEGGADGRLLIDRFLDEFSRYLSFRGRILLVHSSFSDPQKTLRKLSAQDFCVEVVERPLFFERLVLFRASKKDLI